MASSGKEKIYFIGIGGAGMSGIAKVLLEMGYDVAGSDLKAGRYTESLVELGADVSIGHDPANLVEGSTIVISSAIPDYNVELRAAKDRGFKILARAEMLGRVCAEKPESVAVAGTHGKTTTTSMIALVLERAGVDPTILVGGELNDIGSNAKYGRGDISVVEADESDGSLVHLFPSLAVITNIDADHLDFHDSLDALKSLFEQWLRDLPSGAKAVVLGDGSSAAIAAKRSGREHLTFGRGPENDLRFDEPEFHQFGSVSKVHRGRDGVQVDLGLQVPGLHNVLNAMAALLVADSLGLDLVESAKTLGDFTGAKRRFQLVGEAGDVMVFDDYAHHPTEVAATIDAAKNAGRARVICVFQPHRFTRTKMLSSEFGAAFDNADHVVLTSIYNAGEEPIPGVSGKLIVDEILANNPTRKVSYIPDKGDLTDYLTANVRAGDVVMVMGAGDIGGVCPDLIEHLREPG